MSQIILVEENKVTEIDDVTEGELNIKPYVEFYEHVNTYAFKEVYQVYIEGFVKDKKVSQTITEDGTKAKVVLELKKESYYQELLK